MVNISKKYLEENLKREIWKEFLKEIRKIKSEKELNCFLSKFFTSAEIIMIEKRIGVPYLLKKGLTWREIALELDISLSSISFIKKGFKNPDKQKKKWSGMKSEQQRWASDWILKKNSKMATSRSGSGRWKFLNG